MNEKQEIEYIVLQAQDFVANLDSAKLLKMGYDDKIDYMLEKWLKSNKLILSIKNNEANVEIHNLEGLADQVANKYLVFNLMTFLTILLIRE